MEENFSVLDEEETEVETINENESIDDTNNFEKPKSKRQIKKELKKERKREKLRFKYLERPDIKYRGPLSYRHLRFLAWVALAFSQMAVLDSFALAWFPDNGILGPIGSIAISYIADLTIPLFIIATFATILNKNKSFKNVLVFYFVAWLGVGLAFVVIDQR